MRRGDLGLEERVEKPVAVLEVLERGEDAGRGLGVDAEMAAEVEVLVGGAPEVHGQAEAVDVSGAAAGRGEGDYFRHVWRRAGGRGGAAGVRRQPAGAPSGTGAGLAGDAPLAGAEAARRAVVGQVGERGLPEKQDGRQQDGQEAGCRFSAGTAHGGGGEMIWWCINALVLIITDYSLDFKSNGRNGL